MSLNVILCYFIYFSDFPTREDAIKAKNELDGKSIFASRCISADLEAVDQRRTRESFMKKRHKYNKQNNRRNNNNNNGGYGNRYNNGYNNNNYNGYGYNSDSIYGTILPAKSTVYLGNLRDHIEKREILEQLSKIEPKWKNLTIRLNNRSGWSHAFVDFEQDNDAKRLIKLWNNTHNPI